MCVCVVLLILLFYCDRRLPSTPLQLIDMMKPFELDKVHSAKHRSDSAKIRPCNTNVYLPTCLLMFINAHLATVLVHVDTQCQFMFTLIRLSSPSPQHQCLMVQHPSFTVLFSKMAKMFKLTLQAVVCSFR